MGIQESGKAEVESSFCCVEAALLKTFRFLLAHDGAGKMEVSVKLLKRGQKEVLIQCGRTYRFVIDSDNTEAVQPEE